MKILITNTVMLNGGDAAILLAEIRLLQAAFGKNVKFIIFDAQPEIATKYFPKLNFRKQLYKNVTPSFVHKGIMKRIFRRAGFLRFYLGAWSLRFYVPCISKIFLSKEELQDLNYYVNSDLIVSTGGTYLVENYSLVNRIFDYKISLIFKKPLIFFTQSLGPFTTPKNKKVFKYIFEKSTLILLRDKKSLKNIYNIHAGDLNINITADAAFALADSQAISAAKISKSNKGSSLKIAISVRYWRYFKNINPDIGRNNYYAAIRAVTYHLIEKYDAQITFISSCQGIPEYWADDSKIAAEVVDGLPDRIKRSIVINNEFHSPYDLATELKNYHFLISTRLHMAILALGVGTPSLPISYEFKTQELFKRLGQENLVQDIENVTSESLINSVEKFIDQRTQICYNLFCGVEKEVKRALNTIEILKYSVKLKSR